MGAGKLTKNSSVFILAAIYVLAAALSFIIWDYIPTDSALVKVAVVDVIATVFVFCFSLVFNNSSVYDPYWSVAPILFVACWVYPDFSFESATLRGIIMHVLVIIWGVRLTFNFTKHWKGMHQEDWRYVDFRSGTGRMYWVVSFFGIHLFPTLIVLCASVPVYFAVSSDSPLNATDAAAVLVTAAALVIEAVSDWQMRSFVKKNTSVKKTFKDGLWAWSRHPNYFGEVLFWWGMFIFALGASLQNWWTVFGPLVMTMLFVTVSLPLMERRMSTRREDYQQVKEEVSFFIPWPKKNKT